jgi:SM-20-related protein
MLNNTLYETITASLVQDGYIIIKDALSPTLAQELLLSLDETHFKKAGISSSSHKHIDTNKRRDKICWLDDTHKAQTEFLLFCKGLQEYLNRTLYLGLSYYEAHFAIYNEGDFYEKHLDTFKGKKNRVVTTVYYLNENFTKEDGGTLHIYNNEGKLLQSVIPTANTLVVFLSEQFPHEVLPAKKKRHSIAGWFRVDR